MFAKMFSSLYRFGMVHISFRWLTFMANDISLVKHIADGDQNSEKIVSVFRRKEPGNPKTGYGDHQLCFDL